MSLFLVEMSSQWDYFQKAHKDKTIYTVYHMALSQGIQPPIPPPTKPTARRTREEIALTPSKDQWEVMTQEEKDAFLALKKTWMEQKRSGQNWIEFPPFI